MVGNSLTQTGELRGYLFNNPEVTVKGIEADATTIILPGLIARTSFAYSDGEYCNYPAGFCSPKSRLPRRTNAA